MSSLKRHLLRPADRVTTDDLRLDWVTDSEGFLALEPQLRALFARTPGASVFLTFEWQWRAWGFMQSQAEALRDAVQLRLLVGRVGERVALIFPLALVRGLVTHLSSRKFEYHDVLVEAEPKAAPWVRAAWRKVLAMPGAHSLDLFDVARQSNLGRLLAEERPGGVLRDDHSPVIALDRFVRWEDYVASLPSKLMADQRRQWRRLGEISPGFAFEFVAEPAEIVRTLDWMFDQKVAWAEKRDIDTGVMPTQGYRRFMRQVVLDMQSQERLLVGRIAGEAGIMSAGFGFVHRETFVFYMFAYDEAYGALSPSRLLMERLMRWCFERGVRVFDFLPGPEVYKRSWTNATLPVVDYVVPISVWGRVRLAWTVRVVDRLARQDWLRRGYDALPAWLRQRVRGGVAGEWDRLARMTRV